jgi:hypothetical protein
MPAGNDESLCDGILDLLNQHPGSYEVLLERNVEPNLLVRVRANPAVRVQHSETLVSDLKQLGCAVEVASKMPISR